MTKVLNSAFCVALLAGGACGGGPTPPNPPPPPTAAVVSSITPASGTAAGGTVVTITGSNFASGATAAIGGVPLTALNVASATTITGTTGPRATAGQVSVTVTNPGASAGTLSNAFTYTSAPQAVITAGGATRIQHDTPINFSGLTSTTTSPYTITQYRWSCGQDPTIYGNGCEVTNNPTPTFNYRKCGVSGRPPCTTGTERTYTITLTITDSAGNQHTGTYALTVSNRY